MKPHVYALCSCKLAGNCDPIVHIYSHPREKLSITYSPPDWCDGHSFSFNRNKQLYKHSMLVYSTVCLSVHLFSFWFNEIYRNIQLVGRNTIFNPAPLWPKGCCLHLRLSTRPPVCPPVRDFILIHQTFRIALIWHYLGWYCIWVILVNIFMLLRAIISVRWVR